MYQLCKRNNPQELSVFAVSAASRLDEPSNSITYMEINQRYTNWTQTVEHLQAVCVAFQPLNFSHPGVKSHARKGYFRRLTDRFGVPDPRLWELCRWPVAGVMVVTVPRSICRAWRGTAVIRLWAASQPIQTTSFPGEQEYSPRRPTLP